MSKKARIAGGEHQHLAFLGGALKLAVAASRRLGDLVEPGPGAQHQRKIEIDAGLDQRGRDHAARPFILQVVAYLGQHPRAMDAVHAGR